MSDSNRRTIERLFEDVWNDERPDTAEEVVHEEYVIHDRELAETMQGPELYTALADATREIFPDATFTIEDVIASGDEVAVRWTMVGTHEGRAFGVDPTGKRVELEAIEIDRFVDDKLGETWTQSDQLGLMEQVGALSTAE